MLGGTPTFTTVSCFGGSNGTASILPYGGSPSYSYLWGGGQTTSAVSNLAAGNYSLVITDSKGCTATASVPVSQPNAITNTLTPTQVSCYGNGNGMASIASAGGTPPFSYAWSTGGTGSMIANLVPQIYTVTITDSKACTSTASVSVTQPAVLAGAAIGGNAPCYGGYNGTASVVTTGGTLPYSFAWSSGSSAAAASNLGQGIYSVSVTDAHGCTASATVSLTQLPAITAAYTASSYTVDIALGSDVTFTNSSTGALTYQWNFGDGSAMSTVVDPVHTYSATGTFTVTLISSDAPCADTAYATVVVSNSNPTALPGDPTSSLVNVGYENGEVYLLFSLSKETQVNISVYNMMGQEILSKPNLLVKDDRVKLDLPSSAVGVYIAVSQMTETAVSKKILIPIR